MGRGIEPGHVEGYVEHPEEGGEIEVVHDDGEGEALLPLHLHRQHVRQETAVGSCVFMQKKLQKTVLREG